MAGQRWRYAPLLDYLEVLPAAQSEVQLSFPEIEALIGGPLPRTATVPGFWTSSHTARLNWRRSGFTARLLWPGPAVRFSRR
jgi:hypothetical protein